MDTKKYSKLSKLIILLDDMKKKCLMLENNGVRIPAVSERILTKCTTMKQLIKVVKAETKYLKSLVKIFAPEFLDDCIEYEAYTHDSYGRKFWNEIPLPAMVESFFEKAKELTGTNKGSVYLESYDMSNAPIYFSTLKELYEVVEIFDFAPANIFNEKDECINSI